MNANTLDQAEGEKSAVICPLHWHNEWDFNAIDKKYWDNINKGFIWSVWEELRKFSYRWQHYGQKAWS